MASIQTPQTDYSVKTAPIIPRYTYSRLYQQPGGTTFTVGATTNEITFELPPRCFNLSRSILSFVATPAATTDKFNRFFQHTPAFLRQVDLYTRGGTFLCTINNFDQYATIVLKAETNLEDVDYLDYATTGNKIYKYGEVVGIKAAVLGNNFRPEESLAATDSESNNFEPNYLTNGSAITTATPVFHVQFPMSHVKNTILAMDKDFFFNEVLLLRFTFNPNSSWGFVSTAATSNMSSAFDTAANANAVAAYAGNIAITELSFFLAIEENMEIASALISTVQSAGLSTVIPYVYTFSNAFTGDKESQNVSVRLNRAHGQHLKRIYHTLFYPSKGAAIDCVTRYVHNNLGKTMVSNYYTAVNNMRLTEFDIRPTYNEDWLIHKDILKGTILGSSHDIYLYNWVSINKFDDELMSNKSDTVASGLSLDTEIKWDFYGTTSTPIAGGEAVAGDRDYRHFTATIVTRNITINREGIFIQ